MRVCPRLLCLTGLRAARSRGARRTGLRIRMSRSSSPLTVPRASRHVTECCVRALAARCVCTPASAPAIGLCRAVVPQRPQGCRQTVSHACVYVCFGSSASYVCVCAYIVGHWRNRASCPCDPSHDWHHPSVVAESRARTWSTWPSRRLQITCSTWRHTSTSWRSCRTCSAAMLGCLTPTHVIVALTLSPPQQLPDMSNILLVFINTACLHA